MRKLLGSFLLLIFILAVSIFFFENKVKIQEPIFIGHVYGDHKNSDIPYEPLKKVIKKNNLDFIIFGGDITKNHKDFHIYLLRNDFYLLNMPMLTFQMLLDPL